AHLLTARDERVQFSFDRFFAQPSSEREETIGLAGHGAYDGDHRMPGVARPFDSGSDLTDPVDRSDARATILLDDQAQSVCILVRHHHPSISFFVIACIAFIGGAFFTTLLLAPLAIARPVANRIAIISAKLSFELIEKQPFEIARRIGEVDDDADLGALRSAASDELEAPLGAMPRAHIIKKDVADVAILVADFVALIDAEIGRAHV